MFERGPISCGVFWIKDRSKQAVILETGAGILLFEQEVLVSLSAVFLEFPGT
jgi:hypothetical protein